MPRLEIREVCYAVGKTLPELANDINRLIEEGYALNGPTIPCPEIFFQQMAWKDTVADMPMEFSEFSKALEAIRGKSNAQGVSTIKQMLSPWISVGLVELSGVLNMWWAQGHLRKAGRKFYR